MSEEKVIKEKKAEQTVKVKLSVYERYDLTGGGMPFGHVRVFHVELSIDTGNKIIVRNENSGHELIEFMEKQGKKEGDQRPLPWGGRDYSSGFEQDYLIPISLTTEEIEKQIPFKPVRF